MKKGRYVFPRYPQDIHTPHLATPKSAKRSIQITQNYIQKQKTQIALLQQKLRQAQRKINNLQEMVTKLRADNMFNADTEEILMVYL